MADPPQDVSMTIRCRLDTRVSAFALRCNVCEGTADWSALAAYRNQVDPFAKVSFLRAVLQAELATRILVTKTRTAAKSAKQSTYWPREHRAGLEGISCLSKLLPQRLHSAPKPRPPISPALQPRIPVCTVRSRPVVPWPCSDCRTASP